MPATQTQHRDPSTDGRSPYPRENYFSSMDEEYDPQREVLDPSTHDHHSGQKRGISKDEWIVKTLMKGHATMLCPITLHEDPNDPLNLHDENEKIELTDPQAYPPQRCNMASPVSDAAKKSPSTSRWRVNRQFGYLTFGGVIEDQPTETFMESVEELIAAISADPLDSEIEDALERARQLKSDPNKSDTEIKREVLTDLLPDT